MPNHTDIYNLEADRYHEMIAKQRSLRPDIEAIRPVAGLDIVDLGAGTGRLTLELAPGARSIIALDASEAMLQVLCRRAAAAGHTHVSARTADNRSPLPLAAGSVDLIVAGWTICYATHAGDADARRHLGSIIAEMKRVLRPNGTIVILETMGTGTDTPNPPAFLTDYYAALEQEYGFAHRWTRMDYTFVSLKQAVELTGFFFGEELAEQVRISKSPVVRECAGMWVLQL